MKKLNLLILSLAALTMVACGESTSSITSSQPASTTSSATSVYSATSISSATSSASSISSDAQKYAITKASDIIGGDIAFDKTSAAKDEIVTVTITTEENYVFNHLTSTSDVTFTKVNDTTYTFVMIESNVEVSASFIKKAKINSIVNTNLSVTEYDFSTLSITENSYYLPGETVTATIAAANQEYGVYYTRLESVMIYVGDTVTHFTYNEEDKSSAGYLKNFSFSFTMPEVDTDIYFYYSNSYFNDDTGHSVTVEADANVKVLGINEQLTNYSSLSFGVVRKPNNLVKAYYRYASSATDAWETLEFSKNYSTGNVFDDNNFATASLYSLQEDVIIKITSEAVEAQPITYLNTDLVTFTSSNGKVDSCIPGENVILQFKEVDANKYIMPCVIEGVEPKINEDGTLQFEMPNNEVKITFVVGDAIPVTFTASTPSAITNLSSIGIKRKLMSADTYSSAIPSSNAYLTLDAVKCRAGNGVESVQINDGEKIYLSSGYFGNYFELPIPASGTVSIKINTAYTYNATVRAEEGISINLQGTSPYIAGTTVSASYYISDSMLTLKSFKFLNADDEDITSTVTNINISTYNFSFTMPNSDVIIVPVLERAQSLSVTVDLGEHADLFATGTTRSNIYNSSSYGNIYFPAQEGDSPTQFKVGDKFSVNLQLVSSDYDIKMVVTNATSTTTYEPDSTYINVSSGLINVSFNNSYNYYQVDSDTVISFTYTLKDSVAVSLTTPEDASLTYIVNGASVSNLDKLHVGDLLKIKADCSSDGYMYNTVVKDSEGNDLATDYNGYFEITGDIVVTFNKTAGYKLTVNCPLSSSDTLQYSLYDGNYKTLNSGEKYAPDTTIKLQVRIACHVVINVNGSDTPLVDADYGAWDSVPDFTLTNDTVVTITIA